MVFNKDDDVVTFIMVSYDDDYNKKVEWLSQLKL